MLTVNDRPDLKQEAESCYDDVLGVFTQDDTCDVHVYVVYEDADGIVVAMYDAPKDEDETPGYEELARSIDGAPHDEQRVGSLQAALDLIVGSDTLKTKNPEFRALQEQAKVARMSKYARKQYLRDAEGSEDDQ